LPYLVVVPASTSYLQLAHHVACQTMLEDLDQHPNLQIDEGVTLMIGFIPYVVPL
jgi:hypothetical protein